MKLPKNKAYMATQVPLLKIMNDEAWWKKQIWIDKNDISFAKMPIESNILVSDFILMGVVPNDNNSLKEAKRKVIKKMFDQNETFRNRINQEICRNDYPIMEWDKVFWDVLFYTCLLYTSPSPRDRG